MSKDQFDMFEQPPPNLARGHSSDQVSSLEWKPPHDGHPIYLAAQELVHFTAYLKLSEWQQKYLWPHLGELLKKLAVAESDHSRWFELGYIISAQEIEQIRSRSAAAKICAKYGVIL